MKKTLIKLFAIAIISAPMFAVAFFSGAQPLAPAADAATPAAEAAETYKSKCAMCHSPKAEKFFDLAKTDEQHVEIILKGKKGEKPPFMPGYEAKGMTQDEAKALVTYMRELRK